MAYRNRVYRRSFYYISRLQEATPHMFVRNIRNTFLTPFYFRDYLITFRVTICQGKCYTKRKLFLMAISLKKYLTFRVT